LVDGAQFHRPWAREIGSPWSEGSRAVVVGQVGMVGAALMPLPRTDVVFAGLKCSQSAKGERLPLADSLVDDIAQLFQMRGFRVRLATLDAGTEAVQAALQQADIMLVVAHATQQSIKLRDGDFTCAHLDALSGPPRCRLLLLAACELGNIGRVEDS